MFDFSFLTLKEIFTIFHLLGVVFGAGGAAASDFMFFKSVKDHRISRGEERFLRLGSAMTWGGLVLLIVSGLGIFALDPAFYLQSDKFLAKMLIVAFITLNGAFFHFDHLPWLRRHLEMPLRMGEQFDRRAPLLIFSGVVSATSWTAALVLGSLRSVPMSFWQIMAWYVIILTINILIGLRLKNHILCIPGCVCTDTGCRHVKE